MDLKSQVPIQYCSLQHRTLLLPPDSSTNGHYFCFVSASSFLLELFFHSSPVAYWLPTYLGSSSFSVISFCFFVLFMGFSRQEYQSHLSLPSPVDHVCLEFSTMIRLSLVALEGLAHGFIELDKAVVPVISLVIFLWLWFSLSLLWWLRIRGLWKLPDGKELIFLWGEWILLWGERILLCWASPCSVNPIFCWWVGLCCLPVIWSEAKLLQKDFWQCGRPPRTAAVSIPDPRTGHCHFTLLLETPKHS